MKLGVISDTHGLWRPEIETVFAGVQEIFHAGDVGRLEILERLRRIAPVTAVRGNVDECGETAVLPVEVQRQMGGLRFLMRHVGAGAQGVPVDLRRLLALERIQVFVFGHSHRTCGEYLGGTLLLNPGAAGPRRFSLPVSVAILEIEGGKVAWRFWDLKG